MLRSHRSLGTLPGDVIARSISQYALKVYQLVASRTTSAPSWRSISGSSGHTQSTQEQQQQQQRQQQQQGQQQEPQADESGSPATTTVQAASAQSAIADTILKSVTDITDSIASALPDAVSQGTPPETNVAAKAAAVTYAELASSVYKATEEVLGPLSLANLAFGLQAVAKQHRDQGRSYDVKGTPCYDRQLLSELLEACDLAYAAYKINPQSACAVSHLRLHNIRKFVAHNTRLRPAYFIAVDHSQQTIIWAIRGTKNISDVITDISGASTPLDHGRVHWGVLQASKALLREECVHLSSLTRSYPGYRVLLVGHSLGGGVAAMITYLINTRLSLRRQFKCCPRISSISIASPAVMSSDLAAAAEPWSSSVVYSHDPVPRLSPVAVQALRDELLAIDWTQELRNTILEAEYTQAITGAINSAGSTTSAAAAQLQKLAAELLQSKHIQELSATLNTVVYGKRGRPAAAAAVCNVGSNATGLEDSSASKSATVAQEHQQQQSVVSATGHDWWQQQQEQDEQRLVQQWQQQVSEWQQCQQQDQIAVIRRWMDDVSAQLLPHVKGELLRDADISKVAGAAVDSLNSSLKQLSNTSIASSIAQVGSSISSTIGSTLRAGSDQRTSGSSSWEGAVDAAADGLNEGMQQIRSLLPKSDKSSSNAQQQPDSSCSTSWGRMMSVFSDAGQLLIRSSTDTTTSSGSHSSSNPADVILQWWRGRDGQHLISSGDGSRRDGTLKDQAEAIVTKAAAATVESITAAGEKVSSPFSSSPFKGASVPVAAAAAATGEDPAPTGIAAAAASTPVVNLFPAGKIYFLVRQDRLAAVQDSRSTEGSHSLPDRRQAADASSSVVGRLRDRLQHASRTLDSYGHVPDTTHGDYLSQEHAGQQDSRLSSKAARAVRAAFTHYNSSRHRSGLRGLVPEPQLAAKYAKCKHVLIEVGREGHFDRLVLHPDMFEDHRTRSYRAALLDTLKSTAVVDHQM